MTADLVWASCCRRAPYKRFRMHTGTYYMCKDHVDFYLQVAWGDFIMDHS